jgi:hypothetical protein
MHDVQYAYAPACASAYAPACASAYAPACASASTPGATYAHHLLQLGP